MKRSALTVTFLLASLLLLAVVPAFAASTWTVLGEAGSPITNVQVTRNSSTYDITMNLTVAAVRGNTYSVYFSPTYDVFDSFVQNIDGTISKRGSLSSSLLSYTLTDDEWVLNSTINVLNKITDPSKLSWTVNSSDMLLTNFWFGGEVIGTTQNGRTAVAATPIPGGAWLLGSGILGLIGLRRRKTA